MYFWVQAVPDVQCKISWIAFPFVCFIGVSPHIPSSASEPRNTVTFCCVLCRSCVLFNPHGYNGDTASNCFGRWIHWPIFQETSNLYHILEPKWKTFSKNYSRTNSLGSNFIIHSALRRNAATLRKVLAPLSFSHVIDHCSFFPLSCFFFAFFLDFYGN